MNKDWEKLKSRFDIFSFLDDNDVKYWRDGENVGEGWIGLQCLFCDDHFNHLGVRLDNKAFKCWLCGSSGGAFDLVMAIKDCTFKQAVDIVEEYQDLVFSLRTKGREVDDSKRNPIDMDFFGDRVYSTSVPAPAARFLRSRYFDLGVCDRYGLYYGKGKWRLRLLAPITVDGEVLSFQGIDVTGRADLKYKDCPIDDAAVHNKNLVYGLDGFYGDEVILVEGVLDKWRVGDKAIALMGKGVTTAQKELLRTHVGGKRVKVLLDSDAEKDAEKIGSELSGIFQSVSVIVLSHGDPADLLPEDVREIMEM